MGLLDRVRRTYKEFMRNPVNMGLVEHQLDKIIAAEIPKVEKASLPKKRKSKLDIRKTKTNLAYASIFSSLASIFRKTKQWPPYGTPARDFYLDNIWKEEPILAGAIYSMVAKMTALSWSVTGKREEALGAAKIFARAAHIDGYYWGGFIASTALDFYTLNRGAFVETARATKYKVDRDLRRTLGKLADIGHIDALACTLTGNKEIPMVYVSEATGQIANFKQGEYMHFTSMPSPREINLGQGMCAVDRSLRAVQLLIGLHDYDAEKLSNLPPEGICAITGLTLDEVMDAFRLWRAKREQDDSLTFPQVLWLIGSQPNAKVDVNFVGFSQTPESFDRQTVVTQYVSTLALDFGVDAREFWPISSGALGTASESEIQHMKARGKGHGEIISITERHLNEELPDGVDFAYDTQDIEEDMEAATVAKAWIDAFFPLTSAGGATDEILKKDEFMRLLSDKGVIPDYMVHDGRIAIEDSDVHDAHKQLKVGRYSEDVAKFEWQKNGILKEVRPPTIYLHPSAPKIVELLPYAGLLGNGAEEKEVEKVIEIKQVPEDPGLKIKRNIKGKPIPEQEVVRGARITKATIRDELKRWRSHPVLSQYALDKSEESALIDEISN